MLELESVHHIAIICSNYEHSKFFYTNILGLKIIKETYRKERQSYKLDLALNDVYCIELFSFPHPPKRLSKPESTGLRHLAFSTKSMEKTISYLTVNNIPYENIRVDVLTNKKFTFIQDPDGLPIEFYEL